METTDLFVAEEQAIRAYKEMTGLTTASAPRASGKTFGALLRRYLFPLEERLRGGEAELGPESSAIRRNILPFFEQTRLNALSYADLFAWREWRLSQPVEAEQVIYRRGREKITATRLRKPPSAGTLRREKNYIVAALDWGARQPDRWVSPPLVNEFRSPPLSRSRSINPKDAQSPDTREALTPAQSHALVAELKSREAKWRGSGKHYEPRLMGFMARLLLASGMRPGKEILEPRWRNVETTRDEGSTHVTINKCGNGKTGPRLVHCGPETPEILQGLRLLLKELGFGISADCLLWLSRKRPGEAVQDLNGSFKSVLKTLGFVGVADKPLYVARHTYITNRLRDGVNTHVIAKNCGTSAEMIEKHYAHLLDDDVRNGLRPKKPSGLSLHPPDENSPRVLIQMT